MLCRASNKSLQKISRALQPKKKRQVSLPVNDLIIDGFRIEHSDKEPEIHDGVLLVRAGAKITLRLFGTGIFWKSLITIK